MAMMYVQDIRITRQDTVEFSYTSILAENKIKCGEYYDLAVMVVKVNGRTFHALEKMTSNEVEAWDIDTAEFVNLVFPKEGLIK